MIFLKRVDFIFKSANLLNYNKSNNENSYFCFSVCLDKLNCLLRHSDPDSKRSRFDSKTVQSLKFGWCEGLKSSSFPIWYSLRSKGIVAPRSSWNRLQTTHLPLSYLQSFPNQRMLIHSLWTIKNLHIWTFELIRSDHQAFLICAKQWGSNWWANSRSCHLRSKGSTDR